jgi:hypothetical protein
MLAALSFEGVLCIGSEQRKEQTSAEIYLDSFCRISVTGSGADPGTLPVWAGDGIGVPSPPQHTADFQKRDPDPSLTPPNGTRIQELGPAMDDL